MAAKKQTYEQAISKLQEIVSQIDSSEIGIDQLADKLKEANKLIEQCEQMIAKTENEVSKLMDKQKEE